jgi:Pvc16 N-terminal domain
MFIRTVDEGLEQLLRAQLPLPPDLGDITFDSPTSNWSAQLSRLTVNLFLYELNRSSHPSRSPTQRIADETGKAQRKPPQPMIELGYLVSAWAGSALDEHQLLGNVISCLTGYNVLPEEYLPAPVSSTVYLSVGEDDHNRIREIWTAAGGSLKGSFTLQATVAADSFDWRPEAPMVTHIQGLAAPQPSLDQPMDNGARI